MEVEKSAAKPTKPPSILTPSLVFCQFAALEFYEDRIIFSLRESLSRLPNMTNFHQNHGNLSDLHLEVTSFAFP